MVGEESKSNTFQGNDRFTTLKKTIEANGGSASSDQIASYTKIRKRTIQYGLYFYEKRKKLIRVSRGTYRLAEESEQ